MQGFEARSSCLAGSDDGVHFETHLMEQAMRTLPIAMAYLRAGSFMENWLGALDHIRATGEMSFFYAPLERKFPLVATLRRPQSVDVGVVIDVVRLSFAPYLPHGLCRSGTRSGRTPSSKVQRLLFRVSRS
jgi:hypothetical protein